MGSISTTRGDGGQTGLAGGIRVSKASLRVDAYGNVDELISTLGFARSLCEDQEIAAFAHSVQKELFKVGSSMATPPQSPKPQVPIGEDMVDRLTAEVHRIEALPRHGVRLVDLRRTHRRRRIRRGAHDLPPRRTRSRPADRIGETVQPAMLAVSQSPVRSVVALRTQARTGCRGQRIAARGDGQGRQSMVARVVNRRLVRAWCLIVLCVWMAGARRRADARAHRVDVAQHHRDAVRARPGRSCGRRLALLPLSRGGEDACRRSARFSSRMRS